MPRRPQSVVSLPRGDEMQAVQFEVEDTVGTPTVIAKTAGVVSVSVLSNSPSLTTWKVQCTARAGFWWVALAQTAVPITVASATDHVVLYWPDFDAGAVVNVHLAQVPIA